jgi:hypothetical protein
LKNNGFHRQFKFRPSLIGRVEWSFGGRTRAGQTLAPTWPYHSYGRKRWNFFVIHHVDAAEGASMRIIFIVMVASVLSILVFKYTDQGLGGGEILASPAELSAQN